MKDKTESDKHPVQYHFTNHHLYHFNKQVKYDNNKNIQYETENDQHPHSDQHPN